MEYFIHIAIIVSIYTILSLSLNLMVGYSGLLSMTQAAFYGIGAYSTAILMTRYDLNFFLSVLIGLVISALLSFIVGLVLSRFRDDYFALGSFGFNVIVYSILLNWQELTRGPFGIPGIERPSIFGFILDNNFIFLIFAIICTILVYLFCKYLTDSSFGRVLKAIREDEKAIAIFGYKTHYYKLAIFVISGAIASIAGSLFASYITFVDPSSFTINESIFVLSIIILGGLASNKGSFVGAMILILLPEILRFVGFPIDIAAQMRQAVYGLILILFMMYKPEGLFGKFKI